MATGRTPDREGDQAGGESEPSMAGGSARRGRPATMMDIASATGVSRSTVSRILNNATLVVSIAPETRERVTAVARDLGYRPNPLARALRGAPTMLLGAIVRDITDPFFAGAIEAVSIAARAIGYNIVLGHAHAEALEALALAAVLEARQCDAILLLGDMGDQPRLLADLRDANEPVVALWQGSDLDLIPGVQVDNRGGIETAMQHLVALGHRRIAFIGGRLLGDIRERQTAYGDAMSALGDVPADYVQHVANSPAGGEAAFNALMRLTPRPTAIVASTDVLAIGVLRQALVTGIRVPQQLSVVGFDDIPMASFTVPALTTMRMPMTAMATAAVALAVAARDREAGRSAIAGLDGGCPRGPGANVDAGIIRSAPVLTRVFKPTLVTRQSTGPCPPDGGAAGGTEPREQDPA